MNRIMRWAFVLALVLFSGCYESPGIAIHEPGVYKGKTDPLLAKQRSDAQQQELKKRFELVQTDR